MKQGFNSLFLVLEAICYLGYLWAAVIFCQKYVSVSKRNGLLFTVGAFMGRTLLAMLNQQFLVCYIVVQMLDHTVLIGLMVILFQGEKEKKLLAASMIITVQTLIMDVCGSLLSCVILIFKHTIQKIPVPLIEEWESSIIVCVGFGIAILAIGRTAAHVSSVFYHKSRKWYLMLAIPLLMMVGLSDVAGWGACHGVMVRSAGNMGLYFDQIVSHAEYGVMAALSIFAAGLYVFGMERIDLEQKKSSQYHSQIAVYKMLQEQYSQSEGLRHDMKNHIIALLGLFQNKEWEKLGEYLHQMEGNSLQTGGDVTGNKAVDALLYQKRKQAEREHILWECDVQIPKGCGILEFDLCILFGNILDNALEACERLSNNQHPFVNIQGKAVKKCFLIGVKNSMETAAPHQAKSMDKRAWEHGIGLRNVRDVVQKYQGAVDIKADGGSFLISILIPMEVSA